MPQIEHRVTRSAKVKLRMPSTHPQADHVVPSRRKQGIRRKAQDSSSYMLDKYLDSEVITLSPVNAIKGGVHFWSVILPYSQLGFNILCDLKMHMTFCS